MPFRFDEQLRRYVDDKGAVIPRGVVRNEVRKISNHVAKEARSLSKALQSDKINLASFTTQMSDLLRSGHIASAVIGRGGRAMMTQSDWGRVGQKIAWQNGFLNKFARGIESGAVSPAATNYRAGLYASALWTTFNQTQLESLQTGPDVPGLNKEMCRLVVNSEEGCDECAADEAEGWMSVDDMDPIGSRLCGDFCKCDIEFENDSLNVDDFQILLDLDPLAMVGAEGDTLFAATDPTVSLKEKGALRVKIRALEKKIDKVKDAALAGDQAATAKLRQYLEQRAEHIGKLRGVPPSTVAPPPSIFVPPTPPVTPPPIIAPPPTLPPATPIPGGTGPMTSYERLLLRGQLKRAEARIAKLEAEVATNPRLRKSLDAAIKKRDELVQKLSGRPVGEIPSRNAGKFEVKAGETHADAYLRAVKEMEGGDQAYRAQVVASEERIESLRKMRDEQLKKWQYTPYGPERLKLRESLSALNSQIESETIKLETFSRGRKLSLEQSRELLHSDNPMKLWGHNRKVGGRQGTYRMSPEALKMQQDGLNAINAFVDEGAVTRNYVIGFKDEAGRAYYQGGYNHVTFDSRSSKGVRTVVHEIAHSFEYKNPELLRMTNEFLNYRARGEAPQWLGPGYDKTEIARPDRFMSKYMGKVYGQVGNQRSSEILSMGFEELYANPIGFAKADPEYFNFIVRIARGDKLRPGETMEAFFRRGKR